MNGVREHDPGELAQRVGLLVGQASPAEHRDGVTAVLLLDAGEPRVDEVERLLPRGGLEAPTRRRARAAS